MKNFLKNEDFIVNQIQQIDNMFELYIHLHNSKRDKLKELNIAPGFFGLTMVAFVESSILKLSKLFDEDKNTINITKYLNIIEQQKKLIFKCEDLP